MTRDYFTPVMAVLAVLFAVFLVVVAHQRDEVRARVHNICLDVVAGLERELLRSDVDSTEAGLVLGAAWQATRNCVLDLETDARFLSAIYSGDARLRQMALQRVRDQLEAEQ